MYASSYLYCAAKLLAYTQFGSFLCTDKHTEKLRIRRTTLQQLSNQLGVSALFLDSVLNHDPWAKAGHISYSRHETDGSVTGFDGFYQYLDGWSDGGLGGAKTNVWFSYNMKERTSVYLMVDCPIAIFVEIMSHVQLKDDALSHPFALDVLVAQTCASSWKKVVDELRDDLLQWEDNGGQGIPLEHVPHIVEGSEDLFALLRSWHMVSEDLTDLEERLDFLIQNVKIYQEISKNQVYHAAAAKLGYLRSRNQIWKRWVHNYKERTRIIMDLYFSIASRNDNRTNLKIAGLTGKIAEETRRDSSAMITIAVMTMLFLPGTFVSGFFSMIFFDSGTDADGQSYFRVSPRWWYFPVIAIPLTAAVIVFYEWWRRKREAARGKMSGNHAPMKQGKTTKEGPKGGLRFHALKAICVGRK